MKKITIFSIIALIGLVLGAQEIHSSIHRTVNNNQHVVVLFSRPNCIYCRKVAPAWAAIQPEFPEVQFQYVQAGKIEGQRYGFRTVPTFIYYKNGQEVYRHDSLNGTLTTAQLRTIIKSSFQL